MAFRLIPREEKFYTDFQALADELQNGRAGCSRRCSRRSSPIWDKADEIKEVEHKCDFLTHEIIQRLNRTFVTPLDREDIHALARSLDDVMDAIDASATLVRLYRLEHGPLRRPRAGADHHRLAPSEVRLALDALEQSKGRHRRTRSRSTGSRTKPTASTSRRSAELFDDETRSDRRDEVEGDARLPRRRHRSLRGRRQRPRRRRRQARLARDALLDRRRASSSSRSSSTTSTDFTTPRTRSRRSCRRACCRRARRSSGRRSSTSSPRSPSAPRSPRPSAPGMIDVKIVTFAVIFARPDRRDRLGPDHLVLRPADQLVARADRRLRRRGGRQGRLRRDHRRAAGPRRSSSSSCRRSSAWSLGFGADDGDLLDLPLDAARRASIAGSAGCSWCRRRSSA